MSPQKSIADNYEYALKSNMAWAKFKKNQNPTLFEKTKDQQSPKILWIGCSDSRVPETTILGLEPGEVFVHRNIANIISPSDINSMAVIEYAVEKLGVLDIILCGHTGCGGAEAALDDTRVGGVIDHWITPLRTLRRINNDSLEEIKDKKARAIKLAELGVETGIQVLLNNYSVRDAIKIRGLRVHGCMYDVSMGRLRDLDLGTPTKLPLSIMEDQALIDPSDVCPTDFRGSKWSTIGVSGPAGGTTVYDNYLGISVVVANNVM
ncbi:Carbonic anhydrase [Golovinomyces cichoracearum]|uniref:Carbonic anhydrase n=1 Tax=Golovinomyces cichoracearum TaxID=62708 RepID=A0A420IZE0_9PEZI|nr:Carbonic anhydrase [Golovinomyces cichoracearum]